MRVAIHQPNFCPWVPYFEKMRAADLFVVMIHCQFERRGYQSRFQCDGRWQTMAVNHGGFETIAAKRYTRPQEDWNAIKARLHRFPVLAQLDPCISESVAETNIAIIRHVAARLGITTPLVVDEPTALTSTARLVALCQRHGATTYVSGPGARAYMDLDLFQQAGIAVEFRETPPDRRSCAEIL